jgi:surface antigen
VRETGRGAIICAIEGDACAMTGYRKTSGKLATPARLSDTLPQLDKISENPRHISVRTLSMPGKKAAVAVFSALLLSLSSGAQALTYNFLADSPEAYMNEADYSLLTHTLDDLLNNGKDGARRAWKNPATRNAGSIRILMSYTDGNLNCRRVGLVLKTANQLKTQATHNLCKIDNQWTVKEWPAKTFTDEDWTLFNNAAQEALNTANDGSSKKWKNDKTGNSGTFKLISTPSVEGKQCRVVNISIAARKPETAETTMTLCKDKDGAWRNAAESISAPTPQE